MKKSLSFLVLVAAMLFAIPAQALQWNWVEHETPSYFSDNGNGHFRRVITGKTLPDGSLMKSNAKASNRSQEYHGDIITEVPATAEVKYYSRSGFYHAYDNIYAETAQSGMTAIAFDGNDVYIQNPIAGFSNNNWVKGTKDGNTITVPLKQFLLYNSSESYGLYITMADVTTSGTSVTATNDMSAESITYTISADGNTITQNGTSATRTLTVAWSDDDTVYKYGAPGGEYTTVFTWDESYVPTPTVLVELPAGAEVAQWYAEGDGSTTPPEQVNVAFVGDDVYVGGLFANFPDAWIKGTISGTTATFPGLQYIGDSDTYHIWVVGANQDGELTDSFTMTFDATANTLTLDPNQYILANASDTKMYYLAYYSELMLMKDEPAPLQVDVLPYNNDFSTKAKFREFKVIDANNDNVTWLSYNGMARISYATPNDDWLVSPLIKLQAGKFYHISFLARCQLSSYPEKIEVKADKEITAAALSAGLEVLPETDVTSTTFTTFENNSFTVAETGYYCIGIHNISNDMFYCYVDDFLVEAVPATDIEISPESGDLTAALATASEGKNVGNITINLKADGAYTVSAPIVAPASITINGNGATIDASALDANVIEWKAKAAEDTEWTKADVTISAVTVKGLKKALFYSNSKYYYGDFTMDKSIIEQAADATTFDYTKGSVALNFTVTNSTIYAPTATTKSTYSSQSGQKATEYTGFVEATDKQTFTFKKNTMYNLAPTKNFFSHRQSNQKWLAYDVEDNIFVNCGKSGQVIKGMNGGSSGANPTWTIKGNVFNFNGADTSADETTGDTEEPVQESIAGVVTFTDAAAGDFNAQLGTPTVPTTPTVAVGDPRWTVTPAQVASDIVISPESGDIAAALATASEGKIVKNITINLTAGVTYTVGAALVAPASITINGNGATIDASALDANVIEWKAKAAEDTEWTKADVTISAVTVKGLKKALFYSNSKYYYGDFTMDKSIIEQAADATTFDYTKGSVALNFTVTNSTIYAPTATTKSTYSSQSGQKATEYTGFVEATDKQTFTFKKNTMYNLAPTKNFFSHRQSNQKWLAYDVEDNIFVNCGKSGQVIKGMNGGSSGANPTWTIKGNVFNFNGADTSADETTGDAEEPVQNSIAGIVTFTDPLSGDFNYIFAAAAGSTVPASIGDPRWTKTDVATYAITVVPTEGMTLTPEKNYAAVGEKVYATFTLEDGYEADMPEFTDTDTGEPIAFTENVDFGMEEVGGIPMVWIIMPAQNLTITLKTAKVSKITLDLSQEHGQATCISVNAEDPTTYYKKQGKEIYLNVVPDSDYEAVISVICADETVVDVIAETGTYSGQAYTHKFIMPAQDVTAKVTFRVATGIYNISVDGANDIFSDGKPVYNLSGQRVFKGYKGVVIKEGKKIVVK